MSAWGKSLLTAALIGSGALTAASAGPQARPTAAQLEAQIRQLRPRKSVWRAIPWRTCLLDGLAEAKAKNKPVLLWVFIHNPSYERC